MNDDARQQTREDLHRSEELTRRLIEAMPGGVVHVTIDGGIETANAEAQRILGLSYDELSRKYVADFEPHTFFEDGTPCSSADYPVSRALATGEPQPPRTIGVQRPDGQISWAVFTAIPIEDEGGRTTGAVVTFLDITDRKRLERELHEAQRMEAIGRLAGGIAHDFNNLLLVIAGNASHVRRTLAPGHPLAEDLEQIISASDKASSLTAQLLAFASRQSVAPRLLALDELVAGTVSMLSRLIGAHIELHTEVEGRPWRVRVDRSQFEQVIINLTLNARDAMPDGGRVHLGVRNVASPDGREWVEMTVSDSGPGIPEDHLPHIFEPFFTTKGDAAGTGLGLATCYGVAKQAGGSIEVESSSTSGTTFRVRLPRARDVEDPGEIDVFAPHPDAGEEGVLLVDDDPAVRRVLHRGLSELGYRVHLADQGARALDVLETPAHGIDVVVLDVVMPGRRGSDVAREIRRKFPSLPVILVSGYPGEEGQTLPFLRKPFEPHELAATIRESLSAPSDADPPRGPVVSPGR